MDNLNSINNNSVPYYFKADIAKEGGQYVRLSNFFKARVGDNGKVLPFKWYDQGRVMNVHGYIPFIQGLIGKFSTDDNDEVIMASDASYREWQGSTANAHDGGFIDYILEDQMFPQEGIFKGHFGLKDGNGNVLTSVNIIFEVLGNDLRVGETVKYYVGELENLKNQYEIERDNAVNDILSKGNDAVQKFNEDYNAKTQAAQDALVKATKDLSSYAATVETMDAQIKAKALVTKPELDQAKSEAKSELDQAKSALDQAKSDITKMVEDKTANLEKVAKANFNTIASLDRLKKDHATGADGYWITLDTKHMYIWSGSGWTDLGAAGIGDGTVPGKTIKDKSIFDPQVGTINASKVLNSYADISGATKWGIPESQVFIDGDNVVVTSDKAGDRGVIFPVNFDGYNFGSNNLYVDFSYYFIKSNHNYFNVYIMREDGTLVNQEIDTVKNDSGVARICITSDFIKKNSLNQLFKVLVAIHGGSGDFYIKYFRVSEDPNNSIFPEKIKNLDLLTVSNGFNIAKAQGWNLTQGQDVFYADSTEAVFKTGNTSANKGIFVQGTVTPNVTNYIQVQYGIVSTAQYRISIYLTNERGLDTGLFTELGQVRTNTGIHTIKYELTPNEMEKLGIIDKCALTIGGNINTLILKSVRISTTRSGSGILDAVNSNDKSNEVVYGSSMAKIDTADTKTIDGLKLVTSGEKYDQDNGRLKRITLYAKETGDTAMFIGKLDQNNLLVDFRKYPVHYSKGFNELDFSTQNIPVNKGEYVFLDCSALGVYRPDTTHPLGNTTRVQDSNHVMTGQYSGNNFYTADALAPFEYTVAPATSKQLSTSISTNVLINSQKIDETKQQIKKAAVLTSPSGKKFRIFVDDSGTLSAVSTIPTNVQIFGNSLTCYYKDGFPALGATDQNHDWYHYVTDYIKSANSSAVIGPRRNIAPWEQSTNRDEQFNQLIKPNLSADTDLVILQLGDNVNSDALHSGFVTDVMNLFKDIKAIAPKAKIYYVGMWFCSFQDMIDSAQAACRKYDGTFVNIQDLANDPRNKAYIGEVVTLPDGTTKTLTNEGEAIHPGDTGYKKIADRIINSFDF